MRSTALELIRRRHEDVNKASQPALVLELDHAGHLGVQSIVLTATHVGPGLQWSAALADKNRAAGNRLSRETLHAEALRVRITPISRTAKSLLMCHLILTPGARLQRKRALAVPQSISIYAVTISLMRTSL